MVKIRSDQVSTGALLQTAFSSASASATGTTVIPYDDTIPQITEGTEFITITITPKYTNSILYIDVNVQVSYSIAAHIIGALFQDSTANALTAGDQYQATPEGLVKFTFKYSMVAGTTSSTTFRVRLGSNAAGTVYFNGDSSGRRFGAITKSAIEIREVAG